MSDENTRWSLQIVCLSNQRPKFHRSSSRMDVKCVWQLLFYICLRLSPLCIHLPCFPKLGVQYVCMQASAVAASAPPPLPRSLQAAAVFLHNPVFFLLILEELRALLSLQEKSRGKSCQRTRGAASHCLSFWLSTAPALSHTLSHPPLPFSGWHSGPVWGKLWLRIYCLKLAWLLLLQ